MPTNLTIHSLTHKQRSPVRSIDDARSLRAIDRELEKLERDFERIGQHLLEMDGEKRRLMQEKKKLAKRRWV